MKNLSGKVAFVTGAASKRGMGHAIALRLAGEGANVAVADKFPAPRSLFPGDENWAGLADVVKEVEALGVKGLSFVMDVSKGKEVDDVIRTTVEKFGKIDILIHCAAIRGSTTTPLSDLSEEDWRVMIDINLTGSFLIAKAVSNNMISRGEGGKIVLIASMAGTQGVKNSGSYSVSKWGVIGLVKNMALELAPYQININAINPGAILTNLRDEAFDQMAKEMGTTWEEARNTGTQRAQSMIPMGRLGTPEDISNLAYYLVSDQSGYVTGEAIGCNGAMR